MSFPLKYVLSLGKDKRYRLPKDHDGRAKRPPPQLTSAQPSPEAQALGAASLLDLKSFFSKKYTVFILISFHLRINTTARTGGSSH